jgi:putative plasmid recombination enzyme
MKQINFLNNFAKFNSIKDRKSIIKIVNEATRNLSEYKNNVNHNLSINNTQLIKYNEALLQRQFFDTKTNDRVNDIITCISRINTQNISEIINEDLTYFLKKSDWENYFKKAVEIQKKELGENAHCVYAILHFDEATPHLHSMFVINRKRSKKAVYSEEDIDKEKLNKSLKMAFSRYCKQNNISKQNFDKEKYQNFEEFRKEYFNENRQKKIEFQLNKLNKETSTKNYEFATTSKLRINYSKFAEDFAKEMKENKEVNLFKSNIEKVLKEDIEIVKKFDKSLVKSKDLESIKTEMKETKINLVKEFLKDMNNKEKREKMQDFFYKENIVENKKEITNEEFNYKMNKIQEILNKNNDFEVEKIKQLKTLKRKENINKIINFIKSKFDNEEVKKVREFYKKFDKKLDKINEKKLTELEANETKIFEKNKDLNTLNLSLNKSTLNLKQLDNNIEEKQAELKQMNNNIDNNKSILNNQRNLIQNNEEKIRKQNAEINENISCRKNMKYIEKEAINQLKKDIKSNYNFIKQIEKEARKEVKEEYLNSKSFTENIKTTVLDKKIEEQNEILERIINKKNIIEKETETIKKNAIEEATKIKNNALKEIELIKNNSMKKVNEEIDKLERKRNIIKEETEELKNNAIEEATKIKNNALAEAETIKNNAFAEAEMIRNNTLKKISEEEYKIKEKEFKLKQLNQTYDNLNEKVNQIKEKVLENTEVYAKEVEEKIKLDLKNEKKEDFELFCNFNKNLEKSIRKTENLSKQEAKQIIYDTYIETNETIEKKHFNFTQIFEKLFNILKLNIKDFKSKNNSQNLNINALKTMKLSDRQ